VPRRLEARSGSAPRRGSAVAFPATRSTSPDEPLGLLSGLRGQGAWGLAIIPRPPRPRSGESNLLPKWQSHIENSTLRRRSSVVSPYQVYTNSLNKSDTSASNRRRIVPPPSGIRSTYGMHTESSYMRAVAQEEIEQVRHSETVVFRFRNSCNRVATGVV
jgi:hypothetical protein